MTLTQIKPAGLSKPVDLADNEKIRLGTGNDLEIYHNGTANYIKGVNNQFIYLGTNNTNRWSIANDGHIRPEANQTYDIGSSVQQVNQVYAKEFIVRDGGYLKAGNSADLQIYHNGTSSYISNTTGNLYITATSTETAIQIIPNGATDLRYDGTKKFETTSYGSLFSGDYINLGSGNGYIRLDSTGYLRLQMGSNGTMFTDPNNIELINIDTAGNVKWKDNKKALFGEGNDLQIYSNGARAYIDHVTAGTGSDLFLRTKTFVVANYHQNDELMIVGNQNGGVQLYYDNAKKIETKSTGAEVTGNLSSSISASIGTTGLQAGNVLSVKGSTSNQINIARAANNGWGLLLTNSQPSSGYHTTTNSSVNQPCAIVNVNNDALHFGTNNNSRWTIDHSGHIYPHLDDVLEIGKTDKRVKNIHTDGVTFNGDTADANKLDDYEEGTWSPTMNATGALTVHTAHYIKIGKAVTYQAYITFPTMSGSSSLKIQNFPFDVSGTGDYHSCAINSSANLGVGSGKFQLVGQLNYGAFMVLAKPSNVKATISEMSGAFVLFSLSTVTH